ncbi:penicillin-binding transpeptidase domain-containing protein [uncultured Clostridium sp.]|uniref:penicillin-binding transpeptidase domain-containing protein n=1 Tax=uncultured Clostridium sp. TaxID=59620 RepID=UPI0026310A40|nr:penicillin-binding transpeptidase domain-containing protein [uncultured Clostridium sp.]
MRFNRNRKYIDRYSVIIAIAILVFTLILCRLIYLQVFEHQSFESKADIRSTRFMPEPAPRGNIYSSNGDLLATNKEEYTLEFTETQTGMQDFYSTINSVFNILKQNKEFSKLQDKFPIEINSQGGLYFKFPVSESSNQKVWDSLKLRFMYNRALEAPIQNELFPKNNGTFSESQTAQVNKILATYTATEAFDDLVKQYGLYNMLNMGKTLTAAEQQTFEQTEQKMSGEAITKQLLEKYSLTEIRNFMLVKDTMKLQSYSGFKPVIIANTIGKTLAFVFDQQQGQLPGISVVETPVRYYPYGTLASHIIGYIGKIPSKEASEYEQKGYNVSSDLIGVAGLESAYQNVLRGTTGGSMVKVNAAGQKIGNMYTLQATPGDNVYTTINSNLEYTATKALETQMQYLQHQAQYGEDAKMGAVVAVDPNNGNILAMASLPGYNPNDFATGKISQKVFNQYFNPDVAKLGQQFINEAGLHKTLNQMFPIQPNGGREDLYSVLPKPLFNYATMGLVPPGSTFKIATATAALETGVTNATYTISDSGGPNSTYYDAKPNIFGADLPKDWENNGVDNLWKSIEVSSDTYFFNMAAKMYYKYNQSVSGLNVLAEYAAKYGLGTMPGSSQTKGTGIPLPENFGNTYNFSDFKKNSIFYSRWTLVKNLQKGQFPAVNLAFAPLNIENTSSDSKELVTAKTNVMNVITNQLEEIGFANIRSNANQVAFVNNLTKELDAFYKVSPKAQASVAAMIRHNPKLTVEDDLKATAQAVNDWIVYTMYTTITTPAQLGYAAIGQGLSEFTPVQIAGYVSTIANGGTRYKLNLVNKITSPTGQVIEQTKPTVLDKVNLPQSDYDMIKRGMWAVNNQIKGTADVDFGYGFRDFPIPTAGKTGTASLMANEHTVGRAAWGVYISYAPVKNPQIAIAVIIYNGLHGDIGAPVARAMYETYFRDQIKKTDPKYKAYTNGAYPIFWNDGAQYTYSLNPPLPSITDNTQVQSTSTTINSDPIKGNNTSAVGTKTASAMKGLSKSGND